MMVSKRMALAVAGVAAAAVVGTAGIAAATGSPGETAPLAGFVTTTPAPSASGSTAPAPAPTPDQDTRDRKAGKERHGRLIPLERRLHGEWVGKLKTGQTVTVAMINGTVTAYSGSSVTVKAEDGFTATYAINGETVIRGKAGGVKIGDHARVLGTRTGGGLVARAVVTHAK